MIGFSSLSRIGCVILLGATVALAQDPTALFRKAPPEIEESLQATTKAFFDLQVEKKWGASMKYIAEDSLDAYIGSEKDACMSIKILNISYNDDYSDATVAILCERGMATPVGGGRVSMPMTTYWRRVDGEWKWYAPKVDRPADQQMVMTPFGPVPMVTPDQKRDRSEDEGSNKLVPKVSLEQVQSALQIDPKKVVMAADRKSTIKAKVYNSFAGMLQLKVVWVGLKGLTATLDKDQLQSGEVAEVTVEYEPQGIMPPPQRHAVWIETSPMRSATPILIEFKFQEEMKTATSPAPTEQ